MLVLAGWLGRLVQYLTVDWQDRKLQEMIPGCGSTYRFLRQELCVAYIIIILHVIIMAETTICTIPSFQSH